MHMINFRHLKNLIRKQFYQFYSVGFICVCVIHFFEVLRLLKEMLLHYRYSHFLCNLSGMALCGRVEGCRSSFLFFQSVENIVAIVSMPISFPQPIQEMFLYGTLHWRPHPQWCNLRFLCLFPNHLLVHLWKSQWSENVEGNEQWLCFYIVGKTCPTKIPLSKLFI